MALTSNSIRKILMSVVFLFFTSVILVPLVMAETDYKIVSTEQLKAIMDSKQPFMLIDARTKEEYDEAHIITSVNLPEKNFENLIHLLPEDKKLFLIIYCNGVKCGKSKRVAKKAEAAGYTNIMLYNEGFPVWEEKNLPIVAGSDYSKKIETTKLKPYEIQKLIKEVKNDFVLVDVRDESEYKEGHIPTAINIPAEKFALKSEILPKEKKIIVYCNTGSRSYMAYRKLIKLAYPSIYQALFAEWKDAKMPLEK